MRLDADIRQVAEVAQIRRRAAADLVKRGKLKHFNYMSADESFAGAEKNLRQIVRHDSTECDGMVPPRVGLAAIDSIADVVNYALAVVANGDEKPADE